MNGKKKLSMKMQMMIAFTVVAILPIAVICLVFYFQSQKWAEEIALDSTYRTLEKNVGLMDQQLSSVVQSVSVINQDEQLSNIFNQMNPRDEAEIIMKKSEILHILGNRISFDYANVVGVELLTSYAHYTLYDTLGLPKFGYLDSSICRGLMTSNGEGLWYPTYDSIDMFDVTAYANYDLSNRMLFTYGKKLDLKYIKQGTEYSIDPQVEQPLLLIHFSRDYFKKIFAAPDSITSTEHIISDSDLNLVFASTDVFYSQNKDLFLQLPTERTSVVMGAGGEKFVVSRIRLSTNGWTATSVIPLENVVQFFLKDIWNVMYIYILLAALAIIAMVIFSTKMLSKPIEQLLDAIQQTSGGNFRRPILYTKQDEFREVFDTFNEMNHKLDTLIQENYAIKIKEQEMEIQIINLQFNPHFMYNTLNVISLMALSEGQDRISEMIINLSFMIRYCVKVHEPMVEFWDDFTYIKSYIELMRARYEDAFDFVWDIDARIHTKIVPKFILQPFIENAIIHGFEGLNRRGALTVSTTLMPEKITFTVTDNGCGMTQLRIQEVMAQKTNSLGIFNVDSRIKMYYGEDYGVQIESTVGEGTRVVIVIPNANDSRAGQSAIDCFTDR